VQPVSHAEVERELQLLKKKRCRDSAGVVAEMLLHGGQTLVEVLADLYNQVLSREAAPPKQWKESIISVLHKSGQTDLAQNYRPITVIPILYKLFATLLLKRVGPELEKQQSHDQAAYRKGYSTEDHLFTFNQLLEKTSEYQLGFWAASLDFKKAFDSIGHDSLWEALYEQEMHPQYVSLLQSLYHKQQAKVRTDRLSKGFPISRGTKQGDPLSALLFNALLEKVVRGIKPQWANKGYGIQLGVGDSHRVTNLRFADDVLLVAGSKPQLINMLSVAWSCILTKRRL